MRLFHQFSLLLVAVLTPTSFALTVPPNATLSNPATPSGTLQPATQLDAPNPRDTVCSPRGPGISIDPSFSSCAKALHGFPSSTETGTFSNAGRGDFQLPTFSRWRNCEVLVEIIAPSARVRSSWAEIGLAAVELNEACQEIRDNGFLGSGVTYAGPANGIKISLRAYSGRSLGANATDPTAAA